jgi:hypothetical protein
VCRNSAAAEISIPLVQAPHCIASSSTKARCTGWSVPPWASPSIVTMSFPAFFGAQHAGGDGAPVGKDVAGAADTVAAAVARAGQAEIVAKDAEQCGAGPHLGFMSLPIYNQTDAHRQFLDRQSALPRGRQ